MVAAPNVKLVQFDLSAATSGTWGGFIDTTTRALAFGAIDNSVSGSMSATKLVAMSGVEFNGNTVIENMKFYLSSRSDWTTGDSRFYMDINNIYTQNKTLSTSNDNVPTAIPANQNYFRLGGGSQITGSGQVDGLGQWIYLAVFAGTDVLDGTYGVLGGGGFRFRVTFDYY